MLFHSGHFVLHSGGISNWKIDCDALSLMDWSAIARLVAGRYKFKKVIGIPHGGELFAVMLHAYEEPDADLTLVVDDVLTTGRSIIEMLEQTPKPCMGVVLFARNKCPEGVEAVFTFTLKE